MDASELRFSAYVERLVIGHADRAKPGRDRCVGLMLPCESKSVEPMAAVTCASRGRRRNTNLCCIFSAKDKSFAKQGWYSIRVTPAIYLPSRTIATWRCR